MKHITVTVSVPDGETCGGCDFWYRDHKNPKKECYCLLFGLVELEQRFRENMVTGLDVMKCGECAKKTKKQ